MADLMADLTADRTADRTADKNGGSRWRLVTWLAVIGIGVPVLVAVLTLFNLVSVPFWDEGGEDARQVASAEREMAEEGDRFFAETGGGITLRQLRLFVGPGEWQFRMEFSGDSLSVPATGKGGMVAWHLTVDRLVLEGGQAMGERGPLSLVSSGNARSTVASFAWNVPAGYLPVRARLRLVHRVGGDRVSSQTEVLHFGNIPERYREGRPD